VSLTNQKLNITLFGESHVSFTRTIQRLVENDKTFTGVDYMSSTMAVY